MCIARNEGRVTKGLELGGNLHFVLTLPLCDKISFYPSSEQGGSYVSLNNLHTASLYSRPTFFSYWYTALYLQNCLCSATTNNQKINIRDYLASKNMQNVKVFDIIIQTNTYKNDYMYIYINNILYIVSAPTCFDASASSSASLNLLLYKSYKNH